MVANTAPIVCADFLLIYPEKQRIPIAKSNLHIQTHGRYCNTVTVRRGRVRVEVGRGLKWNGYFHKLSTKYPIPSGSRALLPDLPFAMLFSGKDQNPLQLLLGLSSNLTGLSSHSLREGGIINHGTKGGHQNQSQSR